MKQVLSSLQEDFEAIGLAPKSPPKEGSDGEDLDEVKRTKTKKMSGAQKAKERQRYKSRKAQIKKYRKSAKGRKVAKKRAKRVKAGKVGKGRVRVYAGMGQIANIMGDVQKMLSDLQSEDRDEALASFANVAIISDLLARGFSALQGNDLGEDIDAEDIAGATETFADLAAFAAEVATALKEGDLEVDDKLQAAFKEAVTDMLEGLEVFVALTEGDADDDDESDDDDGDETDESTDEGDDGDDDTDESTDEDCDDCDDDEVSEDDDDDSEDDAYAEMRQRLGLGEG